MLCPICKKPVDDAERDRPGSFYPFCSDRCKLVDLGRWLTDRYQIPVRPDDEEDDAPSPPQRPGDADRSDDR